MHNSDAPPTRERHPVACSLAVAVLQVALLLVTISCSGPAPTSATPPSAIAPSGQGPAASPGVVVPATPATPAAPGTLISATPIDSSPGTRAWFLTYHSQAVDGRDIVVTGMLVTPPAGASPATDVPLVTWAHPTTGTADACAPSAKGAGAVPFPAELAAAGYAIVATDYEGLGTTDPHPYLVGTSEGRAVLDAARAATQVDGSGVTSRSPTVIWGFSQGGHAAAFAGQLAPTYAPDVAVKGVAIAAPVSNVAHFAERAESIPDQLGVLVTITTAYAHVYHELDLTKVFTPELLLHTPELERLCIGAVNDLLNGPIDAALVGAPSRLPEFASRYSENEAGRSSIGVPVLVVQGAKDDIIDPGDTKVLVERYCATGTPLQYEVVDDAKHGVMAEQPYLDWTAARFRGDPATTNCPG